MKIWLDLANSPQVLFFRPIIAELRRRGHSVDVTTRAYAQTVQLADKLNIPNELIGHHGGNNRGNLAINNLQRVMHLYNWGRLKKIDLAVSHNSYSQVLAASLLRIPTVTLMDYEHQPLNHLCFRLACRVIVPEPFPIEMLHRYGALKKAVKYSGIKEQVYLFDFQPVSNFRENEGLPVDRKLIIIRPPAPWTAYHRFENNLFDYLLNYLSAKNSGYLLFLPRMSAQIESVKTIPNLYVAKKVYDGPNLLYHADLVISGGGTMNREAAVLGTPTFTLFAGRLGAVDNYLIDQGRMMHLKHDSDLSKLDTGNHARLQIMSHPAPIKQIVRQILETKS